MQENLLLDWLKKNNKWNEKTWKLDILARRISSWTTNISFLLAEKDEEFELLLKKIFISKSNI